MKKSAKDKEIVLTGQYLGVVEEFLPQEQSMYIKDGEIFATISGLFSVSGVNSEIVTYQENNRKTIKIGDIVIGTVVFIRKYSVGLSFYTINQKIHFNSSYLGNIHVSQISNRYVEKVIDAFKETDIVRAKVMEKDVNEYTLSTVGNNLGVIHADCSICGSKLEQIGFDKLKCPNCGTLDKRKLANDYGNVTTNLRF